MRRRRGTPKHWSTLALAVLLCGGASGCDRDPPPDPRLVAAGPGSKSLAAWAEDLHAADGQTRLLGAEALRRGGDAARPHLPELFELLESDPDAGVRRTAAGAVADLGRGSAQAVPALTAALEDEASGVRAWAAHGLAGLGSDGAASALPALRALTTDPSWDVRRAATAAVEGSEELRRGEAQPHEESSRQSAPAQSAPADASGQLEALGYAPGNPTSAD